MGKQSSHGRGKAEPRKARLTQQPTGSAWPGAELGHISACATILQVVPNQTPAAHEEPDSGRTVLRACSAAGTAPLTLVEAPHPLWVPLGL